VGREGVRIVVAAPYEGSSRGSKVRMWKTAHTQLDLVSPPPCYEMWKTARTQLDGPMTL